MMMLQKKTPSHELAKTVGSARKIDMLKKQRWGIAILALLLAVSALPAVAQQTMAEKLVAEKIAAEKAAAEKAAAEKAAAEKAAAEKTAPEKTVAEKTLAQAKGGEAAGEKGIQKATTSKGESLFIETIDVNVVNIDVFVTDKKGVPIRGLTKDDFELLEDNRPVEITNFYAVKGGTPVDAQEAAKPKEASDAPPPVRTLDYLEIPEDQRLNLILFVDNFNIHPLNRNRVLKDLRQFVTSTVKPGDRVMLVSYTRSLKIEQPFTSDPRLVSAALAGLEKMSGHGTLRASERRDAFDRIEDAQDAFTALNFARTYADSVFNDLTFTIRSLKEFISSLAGLPGRKMVVHVSDGIPMVAGAEVFQLIDSKFSNSSATSESFSYDTSRQFQQLVAQANANRVTFYPLDAAGLRTPTSVSASQRGAPGRGTLVDSTLTHNQQDTLHFLANGTGGKAIVNRNRALPALREVASDYTDYYSLGFNPSHAGTGRLYKIKVRLKKKDRGIKLRYRESYRDKSVETKMSDGTLAALDFKFESNNHDIKLEIGAGERRDRGGHYLVPVRVRIPLSKLTLVPLEGTYEGRVRLFVAALDHEGDKSAVQESPVPISIPANQFDPDGDQTFVYTMELLMRDGSHEVAVGMRDDLAAVTSFVRRRVRVGA